MGSSRGSLSHASASSCSGRGPGESRRAFRSPNGGGPYTNVFTICQVANPSPRDVFIICVSHNPKRLQFSFPLRNQIRICMFELWLLDGRDINFEADANWITRLLAEAWRAGLVVAGDRPPRGSGAHHPLATYHSPENNDMTHHCGDLSLGGLRRASLMSGGRGRLAPAMTPVAPVAPAVIGFAGLVPYRTAPHSGRDHHPHVLAAIAGITGRISQKRSSNRVFVFVGAPRCLVAQESQEGGWRVDLSWIPSVIMSLAAGKRLALHCA